MQNQKKHTKQNNPLFTLADGSTKRLSELDWINNEEEDDLYWDYILENDLDSEENHNSPPSTENLSPEETNSANLAVLKEEIALLEAGLKKGYTQERIRVLNTKRNQLGDLESRQRSESILKEHYRRKFLSGGVGSPADFERLWATRIRDEALMEEMNWNERVRRARAHPVYKQF